MSTLYDNQWSNSAKFILVPVNATMVNDKFIDEYFDAFKCVGIFNVIITVLNGSVWNLDNFRTWQQLEGNSKKMEPFSEKSLQSYNFRVIVGMSPPKLIVDDDNVTWNGINLKIFSIIAEKHNSTTELLVVNTMKHYADVVLVKFSRSEADLTVISDIEFNYKPYYRFVFTSDENSYCALVPYPPRLTVIHFLLKPFDGWTWVIMFAATVGCAIFWQRMTKNLRSTFDFVYFVIVTFLGQAIPLKTDKKVLVMLLQFCIFMTFVMGNAYQSMIISYMTTSRDGIRLKTFNDLFSSGMRIKAESIFTTLMNESEDRAIIDRLEEIEVGAYCEDVGQNVAFISLCDSLNFFYNYNNSFATHPCDYAEHYYLIHDEEKFNFIEKFYLAFFSPFKDYIQLWFDRTLETGIRKYWQNRLTPQAIVKQKRETSRMLNEAFLLRMPDVEGVYYILCAGLGIAFVVWVFEMNWKRIKILCLRLKPRRVGPAAYEVFESTDISNEC